MYHDGLKENLRIKKKLVFLALTGMMLAAFLFLLVPQGFASPSDDSLTDEELEEFSDTFTLAAIESSFSTSSDIGKICTTIGNALARVVAELALLWIMGLTLIRIIRESLNGPIMLNQWLKIFARLIMSGALIVMTLPMLSAIDTLGESILTTLDKLFTTDVTQNTKDILTGSLQSQSTQYANILSMIATFIRAVVSIFGCQVYLEMAIRRAFCPLASAYIMRTDENINISSPMSWYIRYFTLYLRVAMMLGIGILCVLLIEQCVTASKSGDYSMFSCPAITGIFIMFAGVKMMGSCTELANSLLLSSAPLNTLYKE